MQKIDRRVGQLHDGTVQTVPWDLVKAKLKKATLG
jgi:hypothetical protein